MSKRVFREILVFYEFLIGIVQEIEKKFGGGKSRK